MAAIVVSSSKPDPEPAHSLSALIANPSNYMPITFNDFILPFPDWLFLSTKIDLSCRLKDFERALFLLQRSIHFLFNFILTFSPRSINKF